MTVPKEPDDPMLLQPRKRLSGLVPGLLDPAQPQRILRHPNSKLSFASFDPRAATGHDDLNFRKLSLSEQHYRAKRVVIETNPTTGKSAWRFVPSAQKEAGAIDEGLWPRLIDICGQEIECTEDQWDIYKLDPKYTCVVKSSPQLTAIRKIDRASSPAAPPIGSKREALLESPPAAKKPRAEVEVEAVNEEDEECDQNDVEDMLVDGPGNGHKTPRSKFSRMKRRAELEEKRRKRRAQVNKRLEQLTPPNGNSPTSPEPLLNFNSTSATEQQALRQPRYDFSESTSPASPHSPETTMPMPKRKVSTTFESLRNEDPAEDTILRDSINFVQAAGHKRTRALSPRSRMRDLGQKRASRVKRKKARLQQQWAEAKQNWRDLGGEHAFPDAFRHETPIQPGPNNLDIDSLSDDDLGDGPEEDDEEEDDEDDRRLRESIRKMAELNADRHLWEAEAQRRKAREESVEVRGRRMREEQQAEERRRKEAAQRQADAERASREHEARRQQEAELRKEQLRKQREAAAKREKVQRQQDRWATGPWTVSRALERYQYLSEAFDNAKFTNDDPVSFDTIPWPTTQQSGRFSIEDISWDSTENFFATVKTHMRTQDYKNLVEKSHRRFHPDRWSSRNILKSITDDVERNCIEVAANCVSQALTPIWGDLRTSR